MEKEKATAAVRKVQAAAVAKAADPVAAVRKANMVPVPVAGGGGSGTGAGSSKGNPAKGTCHIPRPPYPSLSTENGEEGLVVLKVLVGPGGKVDSISVNKSSGYSRLDNAARKAVKDGSCHEAFGLNLKYLSNSRLNKYLGLLIDWKIYAVGEYFK